MKRYCLLSDRDSCSLACSLARPAGSWHWQDEGILFDEASSLITSRNESANLAGALTKATIESLATRQQREPSEKQHGQRVRRSSCLHPAAQAVAEMPKLLDAS